MAKPIDPGELDLVRKAISLSHVRGCCEWDDREAERFQDQSPLPELSPEDIRDLLHDFVVNQGGLVIQVEERREQYRDRRFYYKAVIPRPEFRHGLFVELVLANEDPDGFARRREELIQRLINRSSRSEYLADLQMEIEQTAIARHLGLSRAKKWSA